MNCSEVALFMNDSANDAASDHAALEQHLGRCGDCRAAWQAQALLASVAVPPMSPDLALKIAEVVHSHVSPRGRRKSRLFLGLAACGTVALAFAAFELSSWIRTEVSPTADTADVERRSGGASSDMDVRRPAES